MSVRPPKKYLDKERTQISPAWREWYEAMREEAIIHLGPGQHEMYFPDAYDKAIPDNGCWVRVLEEPHTELRARFRVQVLSIWRARPHSLNAGGYMGLKPQQAVIATPGGDLHLWPFEYQIVPDITAYVGREPDVQMHSLGGEPVFSAEREEQLFYLMSRGITQHDAALMVLNEIEALDFVYFTMHPAYVEMFEGVGTPLWRHVAKHPRASGKPFLVRLKVDA